MSSSLTTWIVVFILSFPVGVFFGRVLGNLFVSMSLGLLTPLALIYGYASYATRGGDWQNFGILVIMIAVGGVVVLLAFLGVLAGRAWRDATVSAPPSHMSVNIGASVKQHPDIARRVRGWAPPKASDDK